LLTEHLIVTTLEARQRKATEAIMGINLFLLALMPVSQSVAWYLVLTKPLYNSVSAITLFYCIWALYNRYLGGNPKELGQFSMGLAAIATYLKHRPFSLAATGLVWFNFVGVSYLVLWLWDATQLAKTVKNDISSLAITWAYVFKVYFVSNIGLWSVVLYKLYFRDNLGDDYEVLPTHD
jgi:hypothetical protein